MAIDGKALHYFEGEWIEGNPPLINPMSHATWMGNAVFDGARYFDGMSPDLDLHCERVVRSATTMGLDCPYSAGEIEEMAREAIQRIDTDEALYIRPMLWGDSGFIAPDPATTKFIMSVIESPMPKPSEGAKVCLSSFKRPFLDTAPTDAKAACLYPNGARAIREAQAKGFGNAIMLDTEGFVSETATSNIWLVKDGAAHTPKPNGSFLNGITRQRMIGLFEKAGIPVHERSMKFEEFLTADEVFTSGNFGKIGPVIQVEDQSYQPGPIAAKAREIYWDFASEGKKS
jgi:branched-chain amino acid aminotransferase